MAKTYNLREVAPVENHFNCYYQVADFNTNCTKFDFGWGSAPDPAGGAFSVPLDLLVGF